MPAELDPAAEAAEFAALVAELEEPEAEEPEEETEPELQDEEDDTDPDELEDSAPELEAAESEAKALLLAGDVKGFCAKLGIDPKDLKINARQFTAMRKGLADAQRIEREGKAKLNQGQTLHEKAEQVYGPIVAGFQAYKQGNPLNLRSAIELMCEDSFENVVATVARAAKGLDPTQVEVIKLRKEMADRDAAQAAAAAKQTEAQQTASEVAKLTTRLVGTPLAKIDGAAEEIYQLVRKSYDGTGYGVTVQEAYATVKAKHAKIAAAFGAKAPSKTVTKREVLSPVRVPSKNLSPADRKAQAAEDEAAEFKRVLKEAKEATKAGERKVRRGAR